MGAVAIRTQAQFEKLADLFVKYALSLQQAKVTKNEAVKKAQADYDKEGRRLEEKMGFLIKAFSKYLRRNGLITDEKKSIQIGRLLMGFRVGNPVLIDEESQSSLEPGELIERIQALAEQGNGRLRKELKDALKIDVKPVLSVIKGLPGRILSGLHLEVHQEEDFYWKIIE
jgi:hypothetical protein